MPTLLRIIRIFFALVAIWQLFGLLPVLNWLPNLPPRNDGLWAILMIKVAVLLISTAIYFVLRRIGNRYHDAGTGPSDSKIIAVLVITILVIGLTAGVVTPMLAKQELGAEQPNNIPDFTPTAVVPQTLTEACYLFSNPPAGLLINTEAVDELRELSTSEILERCRKQSGNQAASGYISPPTQDSNGWTQENTGSSEVGPWLNYDEPGTRYSRMANGMIYRFFPPGMRPDAEAANPFALDHSSDRPPRD